MEDDFLDDIHIRILRITEDLRVIQRELNCAAMEAPGDPELMEMPQRGAGTGVAASAEVGPRSDAALPVVLYAGDDQRVRGRREIAANHSAEAIRGQRQPRIAAAEKFKYAADAALLRYLSEGKTRKPN